MFILSLFWLLACHLADARRRRMKTRMKLRSTQSLCIAFLCLFFFLLLLGNKCPKPPTQLFDALQRACVSAELAKQATTQPPHAVNKHMSRRDSLATRRRSDKAAESGEHFRNYRSGGGQRTRQEVEEEEGDCTKEVISPSRISFFLGFWRPTPQTRLLLSASRRGRSWQSVTNE